jgi:hypothetical protein
LRRFKVSLARGLGLVHWARDVSALTSFCEAKMTDLAAYFLQRAEKCRQNEDAATCARDKADWITLAKEWHRLAEEVDPKD